MDVGRWSCINEAQLANGGVGPIRTLPRPIHFFATASLHRHRTAPPDPDRASASVWPKSPEPRRAEVVHGERPASLRERREAQLPAPACRTLRIRAPPARTDNAPRRASRPWRHAPRGHRPRRDCAGEPVPPPLRMSARVSREHRPPMRSPGQSAAPMRTPVKEPGPAENATASRPCVPSPAAAMAASTISRTRALCRRGAIRVSSNTPLSLTSATEHADPVVSTASNALRFRFPAAGFGAVVTISPC